MAARWSPTLQAVQDALTSSNSYEFDALGMTPEMVECFMDMTAIDDKEGDTDGQHLLRSD